MATLTDIAAQLAEPFPLEDIDFLPKGKVERDGKTLCMALPYADPRVYQDRLNKVAYGEWSTPAPVVLVAGNKLICYVTVIICGVAHTDVGEATNNEENTGTEAWAQAFKRACSQFGLGRYLYNLEKEWVPFNKERKIIDLTEVQKAAIVKKMYQKAGIVVGAPKSDGKALHALAAKGSYEQHKAQANGHQQQPALTLADVQDGAESTGVAKSRKEWQFFNAETFGAFVPDEKLKGDQKRLVQLNDEITKKASAGAGK